MHHIKIDDSLDNPLREEFLADLRETRKMPGKIYTLETEYDVEEVKGTAPCLGRFVFETTSKDIFLGLGSLDTREQMYLAALLEYEFQRERVDSMMFSIDDDSMAIMAIRQQDGPDRESDQRVTFILSRVGR